MPDAVCARVDRLIARLSMMEGNVALFSHGQFGDSLAARWIGLPLVHGQNFVLHTASLSILAHQPNPPHLRAIELWNEIPASRRGS
jgi:broad specificity phosphatase PhoE